MSYESLRINTYKGGRRIRHRYTNRMTAGGAFHAGFFGGLGMMFARLVVFMVVLFVLSTLLIAVLALAGIAG